jgi:hypothetical protein
MAARQGSSTGARTSEGRRAPASTRDPEQVRDEPCQTLGLAVQVGEHRVAQVLGRI